MGFIWFLVGVFVINWLAEGVYTFILETLNFLFHPSERPQYIFQYGGIMGFIMGVTLIALGFLLICYIEAIHHLFFRPNYGLRSTTKLGMILVIPTVMYLTTTRTKTISSWVGAVATVLILLGILLWLLWWIICFLYEWVIA